MKIAVLANRQPADAVTAIAASRQRLQALSARATRSHTSTAAQASAVYCFRSPRASIDGASRTAAATSSPVVNRVSRSSRPSR